MPFKPSLANYQVPETWSTRSPVQSNKYWHDGDLLTRYRDVPGGAFAEQGSLNSHTLFLLSKHSLPSSHGAPLTAEHRLRSREVFEA